MTKIIFTHKYQKIQQLLHLTHFLSQNISPQLQKIRMLLPQMQSNHNIPLKLQDLVHKLFLFMIQFSLNIKTFFQGFFSPDNYSLDMITPKDQQSQDPVLKTISLDNTAHQTSVSLTSQMTGTLVHFYKIFSQHFLDDTTNLISLYSKTNADLITNKLKLIFYLCPHLDYSKPYLTNFMTIVILVSKLLTTVFHNIITYLF